jgi:hypothetical protein
MLKDQPINKMAITYSKNGKMSDLVFQISEKYDMQKKSINNKKEKEKNKNKNYISLKKFEDRYNF